MLQIDNDVLDRIKGSGDPVLLKTRATNDEIVVQSAESYHKLLGQIDELEKLKGIERGIADVEAGRTIPLEVFEEKFRRKYDLPRRSR